MLARQKVMMLMLVQPDESAMEPPIEFGKNLFTIVDLKEKKWFKYSSF